MNTKKNFIDEIKKRPWDINIFLGVCIAFMIYSTFGLISTSPPPGNEGIFITLNLAIIIYESWFIYLLWNMNKLAFIIMIPSFVGFAMAISVEEVNFGMILYMAILTILWNRNWGKMSWRGQKK